MIVDEQTNTLVDEIVLGDADFDYFNGSIAANHLGEIVVGFTRSGMVNGGNLSSFAVVGQHSGGSTTFGDPFLLKEGLVDDYHVFNDRWGDFTTTVVDPFDPRVFWTFQEFALASDAWATQITQIIVPEPSALVLSGAALALIAAAGYYRHRRSPLSV